MEFNNQDNGNCSIDKRLIRLRSHLLELHKILHTIKNNQTNYIKLQKKYNKLSKEHYILAIKKKKRDKKYKKYKKALAEYKSGIFTSFIFSMIIFINKYMPVRL